MKITHIIKKVFYSDGSTPLPIKICFVLFIICLFNAISVTSVFSYLPHLVKDFGSTEVDAGRKSGIVASALFISRIFSSLLWGYACDKFGRKISLLLSGGCITISTLMFGFSFNYPWAVVTRFLLGLSMGIDIIAKAFMSDICDDSNLATGLSVAFLGYNVGLVIGPSMAGFLVFPVETYPKIFKKGSFFDTFKIFIPNFIIVLGMTLALLASVFILPKETYNDRDLVLIEDKKDTSMFNIDAYLNCSVDLEMLEKSKHLESESTRLIDSEPSKIKKLWISLKMSSFAKLLRNKDFLLSSTLYGFLTLFTIGYEDLFPVFASTSIDYGGLGMSTSEIGLLYLYVSITMFILQLVLVNKMIDRFGSKKIFISSSLIFGSLMPFIPLISVIKNKTLLRVILWINQVFVRVAMTSGFTAVNIFINNSVESDLVGLANGIGMCTSCIGRAIGPASFGSLFTWSLANKGLSFPFNQYFCFLLILVITIAVSLITLCVPESLNKKKVKSVQKSTVTVTTSVFEP
ncbi:uncharacterized protein LOC105844592 [Hydra vulgaris]|uniref:uncharacterized protein LOC105844592 n=1 Tax=Hydra vulgaris TaxID=6087 RepID=UPI001F5F646A|nr:protein ZINC INDUCED FACILITATOR-LIKE 1-like [Hydra vulgaris]